MCQETGKLQKAVIKVSGVVQGVGFRPFVYRLAIEYGLGGSVWNEGGSVVIEVTGESSRISRFIEALRMSAPPRARIADISVVQWEVRGDESRPATFRVVESRSRDGEEPGISPDICLCDECRRELLDPSNRRYGYPFINCTQCGPRFTIVEDIPYDRMRTSMRIFPMCDECAKEYRDPLDRRFHAEPTACWDCGPKPSTLIVGASGTEEAKGSDCSWRALAGRILSGGGILAVKGIGGYHLACDALNPRAVDMLRQRKNRPTRPLAVMVRNMALIRDWFSVTPAEEDLLCSPAAPIVILRRKPSCPVAPNVAPGLNHVGVMLPYSPLHLMLMEPFREDAGFCALVMTSGNMSGLPLAFEDEKARRELHPIVDGFVVHDRPIVRPCDDSVVREALGYPLFYRRSRGYVPDEIPVKPGALRVFGAGGEGKNTFCLLAGASARISQHVGDLLNHESLQRYISLVKDFVRLYRFIPDVIAVDPHPGYQVSAAARQIYPQVPAVEVQHHHAHMVAVMAEHGLTEPAIGIILDGTGYGTDGNIWGGEILLGDCANFKRCYHLAYVRMPGGEKAIAEPWRMALAYLKYAYGDEGLNMAERLMPGVQAKMRTLWPLVEWDGFPFTSSAGRLFDAVAALLGISTYSTYDGESASLLTEAALEWAQSHNLNSGHADEESDEESLEFVETLIPKWDGRSPRPLDAGMLVRDICTRLMAGCDRSYVAFRFHQVLARLFSCCALRVAESTGVVRVVLSGGVYQNPLFLTAVVQYLKRFGLEPYWPRLLPPNDGGLSLGQAVACRAKMEAGACVRGSSQAG